jgi:hypothetical protein
MNNLLTNKEKKWKKIKRCTGQNVEADEPIAVYNQAQDNATAPRPMRQDSDEVKLLTLRINKSFKNFLN